jgi:hypothetical protein
MKAINRLLEYLQYRRIAPTRAEKEWGISNGYFGTQLKREADLGEGVLFKIIDNCLDINPEWLLTGRGEMLKNSVSVEATNPGPDYWRDKYYQLLEKYNSCLEEKTRMLKEAKGK